MKQDDGDQTLKKICPQCGKPSAGGRHGGSFTSYLFGASNCSCSDKQLNLRDAQRGLSAQNIEDVAFCPKCGLRNVTEQKGGSLTSWLFQSTRCKCIPDKAFAPGAMTEECYR